MIRIPPDDAYRQVTQRYVRSIASPQFNLAAIRARRPMSSTAGGADRPFAVRSRRSPCRLHGGDGAARTGGRGAGRANATGLHSA